MSEKLSWAILALLLIGLSIQWFQLRDLRKSLKESEVFISERLNTFDEKLGRAQVSIDINGTQLEVLRDELPKDIQKDLAKSNARIDEIAKAIVRSRTSGGGTVIRTGGSVRQVGSDREHVGASNNLRGSISGNGNEAEGNSGGEESALPEASLDSSFRFKDWRLEANLIGDRFSYHLDQRFEILLVEGSRGDGQPTYIRIWELGPNRERLEPHLDVEDFKVTKRGKVKQKLHGFNPKLEVSLHSYIDFNSSRPSAAAELSLSVGSYGETRDDLSWRIGRLGGLVNGERIGLTISPGSYNIGKQLPLVSNVWLSPTYTYMGQHSLGLSIGGVL